MNKREGFYCFSILFFSILIHGKAESFSPVELQLQPSRCLTQAIPAVTDTIIPTARLVENFKPAKVLDYDQARTIMYRDIYNVDDMVSCMYTGYQLPMTPTDENPIAELIKLNIFKSIITEHSYPKSKGAETGNAKSDMHHLFPVRLGVNVSRYNHPFSEISDKECDAWYSHKDRLVSRPKGSDTKYAKKGDDEFEPQDSFKGNVARAVFYFYTMYRKEAMAADAAFFELQREVLLSWHQQDPVDELELKRTHIIAKYQSGKPNPFVLDASLVQRMYGKR